MTKKDREEILNLVNDVRYQLLDKLNSLNRPMEEVACNRVGRDYQRDTYEIVKRMSYEMERERKEKDLEKMKQEKKYLEERIKDTEMSIAYREANYYND